MCESEEWTWNEGLGNGDDLQRSMDGESIENVCRKFGLCVEASLV